MVTFLNLNFLLFFILFFPLSYLVSSKYSFLFFFFFSLFVFLLHTRILLLSPPHAYTLLSSLYLHLHFCFSTSALSFFLFHSIFTAAPTTATSENTINKIHSKIFSITLKCPQIRKHKPTATNTNTSPLPTTDQKTQTQTHIGNGHEIVERGWSSEVQPLRWRSKERKCETEWLAVGRGLVDDNEQKRRG